MHARRLTRMYTRTRTHVCTCVSAVARRTYDKHRAFTLNQHGHLVSIRLCLKTAPSLIPLQPLSHACCPRACCPRAAALHRTCCTCCSVALLHGCRLHRVRVTMPAPPPPPLPPPLPPQAQAQLRPCIGHVPQATLSSRQPDPSRRQTHPTTALQRCVSACPPPSPPPPAPHLYLLQGGTILSWIDIIAYQVPLPPPPLPPSPSPLPHPPL